MWRRIVLFTFIALGLWLSALSWLLFESKQLSARETALQEELDLKKYKPLADLLARKRFYSSAKERLALCYKRAPIQAEVLEAAAKLPGLRALRLSEYDDEMIDIHACISRWRRKPCRRTGPGRVSDCTRSRTGRFPDPLTIQNEGWF